VCTLRSSFGVLLSAVCLPAVAAIGQEGGDRSGRTQIVDREFNRHANPRGVVMMLVKQLSKSETEARDAAMKLAQVGRTAVPILADLLERPPNDQVRYYAVVALSRIRDPKAADALLPMVTDTETPRDLRLMAIDSVASSNQEGATTALSELAGSKDDEELRKKALQSLSIMPLAWRDGEELFVRCLNDPEDEIRMMATKVCFYAAAVKIVYGAAEPKLLSMVESDPSTSLRCQALRALTRMKSGRAVTLSVRLLADPVTTAAMRRQALAAVRTITEVPLKDEASAQTWWEKYGKKRYANAPALRPFTKKVKKPPAEKASDVAGETVPLRPRTADGNRIPNVTHRPPENTQARHAQPAASQPTGGQKRKRLDDDDDTTLGGVPIR